MTILRLESGADVEVDLSVSEVVEALDAQEDAKAFMEFQTPQGAAQVRAGAVIAVIEDNRKGRAGFHVPG